MARGVLVGALAAATSGSGAGYGVCPRTVRFFVRRLSAAAGTTAGTQCSSAARRGGGAGGSGAFVTGTCERRRWLPPVIRLLCAFGSATASISRWSTCSTGNRSKLAAGLALTPRPRCFSAVKSAVPSPKTNSVTPTRTRHSLPQAAGRQLHLQRQGRVWSCHIQCEGRSDFAARRHRFDQGRFIKPTPPFTSVNLAMLPADIRP